MLVEEFGWIPVGERLPDNVSAVYIIARKNPAVGFWSKHTNHWYRIEKIGSPVTCGVTHWKPIILPEGGK